MKRTDELDLDVVREHLSTRIAKGEFEEMLAEVLALLAKLGRRTANLEFELMRLRKATHGPKSEKLDPDQLDLLLSLVDIAHMPVESKPDEVLDAELDAEIQTMGGEAIDATARKPKRRPARRKLPAHLPVRERVLEPELVSCDMTLIGYEEAHTLDWEPGHFIHVHTKRAKYAAPGGDGPIVVAPLPPQAIPRALAEPGLIAHVIVSKYGDHLPLRRLSKIIAREGIDVAPSTMVGWIRGAAELLEPLVVLLGKEVLASHLVQTDDTGAQVLDSTTESGTKRGHLWGYVGDQKLVVFEYTPNWSAGSARRFLAEREGWLQADAYAGYDALYDAPNSKIIEVGCWAHARRYFVEALEAGDPRAAVLLALIQKLYKIEAKATRTGLKHTARLQLRKKHSRTIAEDFFAWVIKHRGSEPPSSLLAKAMTYAINQHQALMRFLEDGRLPLDNTASERALRGIAVGRKNWMFIGHDESGRWAAIMYSLIRTCELNDVEPWKYLRDVLTRLAAGWPASRLGELLPHRWSADLV